MQHRLKEMMRRMMHHLLELLMQEGMHHPLLEMLNLNQQG